MSGKSFVVPGASLGDSYVIPPGALDVDGALDDVLAETRAELAAEAAFEEALPADPSLTQARNAIQHEMTAFAVDAAARRKSHYADPTRPRYSREGLALVDQDFETKSR